MLPTLQQVYDGPARFPQKAFTWIEPEELENRRVALVVVAAGWGTQANEPALYALVADERLSHLEVMSLVGDLPGNHWVVPSLGADHWAAKFLKTLSPGLSRLIVSCLKFQWLAT